LRGLPSHQNQMELRSQSDDNPGWIKPVFLTFILNLSTKHHQNQLAAVNHVFWHCKGLLSSFGFEVFYRNKKSSADGSTFRIELGPFPVVHFPLKSLNGLKLVWSHVVSSNFSGQSKFYMLFFEVEYHENTHALWNKCHGGSWSAFPFICHLPGVVRGGDLKDQRFWPSRSSAREFRQACGAKTTISFYSNGLNPIGSSFEKIHMSVLLFSLC
jgi:hypothetical protein